jgi:hypothetical protein
MPAKAGIQNYLKTLDSRLRGNDVKGRFKTFFEFINFQFPDKSGFTLRYNRLNSSRLGLSQESPSLT